MGAIQQIYESRVYGRARRTLREVYEDVYEGQDSLDQQKYPYRPIRHHRSAWVITCRSWLWRGRYIPLFVNPSDVQWSIPRRGTVQKTAAGAVRNTWLNRYRRTYFDEFTLNITFQSGNIMPSNAYFDKELTNYQELSDAYAKPQVPPGLYNFYRFLELLDVPKLAGAAENRHIIIMHTRVFPVIRLEGFFTEEPITFAESDRDGNSLNWTATFQVYKTFPKISSASRLVKAYQDFVRTLAFNEAIPMGRLRRLEGAANPFKEGIDDFGGIPKGTYSSKQKGSPFTAGLDDWLTPGGATGRGSSTLETKGSQSGGQRPITEGEFWDIVTS